MAIICTNPHVFQGDPGDPPEYEYTDPVTCATCGERHDEEQTGKRLGNGARHGSSELTSAFPCPEPALRGPPADLSTQWAGPAARRRSRRAAESAKVIGARMGEGVLGPTCDAAAARWS